MKLFKIYNFFKLFCDLQNVMWYGVDIMYKLYSVKREKGEIFINNVFNGGWDILVFIFVVQV